MGQFTLLVEGDLDEAIGKIILAHCCHEHYLTFPKRGYMYIKANIRRFNEAANVTPSLCLIDHINIGTECAPRIVDSWLPNRSRDFHFRIVEREIESWLLADRINLADFLAVNHSRIPLLPDSLLDPKQTLINIARKSKKRTVREAITPGFRSTAVVGPLYNAELIRFVRERWNLREACNNSPSLEKCVKRLLHA